MVTLGPRGCIYVDGSTALHVPTYPVEPVDTVAAGDAFCGVLAAEMTRGLPLDAALLRASAGGALATTVAGATSALPTAQAIDRLIVANPAIAPTPI